MLNKTISCSIFFKQVIYYFAFGSKLFRAVKNQDLYIASTFMCFHSRYRDLLTREKKNKKTWLDRDPNNFFLLKDFFFINLVWKEKTSRSFSSFLPLFCSLSLSELFSMDSTLTNTLVAIAIGFILVYFFVFGKISH